MDNAQLKALAEGAGEPAESARQRKKHPTQEKYERDDGALPEDSKSEDDAVSVPLSTSVSLSAIRASECGRE